MTRFDTVLGAAVTREDIVLSAEEPLPVISVGREVFVTIRRQ